MEHLFAVPIGLTVQGTAEGLTACSQHITMVGIDYIIKTEDILAASKASQMRMGVLDRQMMRPKSLLKLATRAFTQVI